MRKVIILGAGGHSRVLLDMLRLNGVVVEGAVVSDSVASAGAGFDVPILGDDAYLARLSPVEYELVNGVGGIIDSLARQRIYEHGRRLGFVFRSVIHPRACVAEGAELSDGVQVMAGAVIQPGTRIGSNSIVNTSSSIDHDCRIGAHVHVAPGVTLSGGVEIGDCTHIGTGACVIQQIRIASHCFIAAGAVVVSDLGTKARVAGVPAKESI
jgi:sugar O-acyltransferase (sialic acid O-acetyltransferase NeuD family)